MNNSTQDELTQALAYALLGGSVNDVREALKNGADPNAVDAYGELMLTHAFASPKDLAVMLKAGARVDTRVDLDAWNEDGTPGVLDASLVEALVNAAADWEREKMLDGALDLDYASSLTLLLEHGADWRVRSLFDVPHDLAAILRAHEASHLEKELPPPAPATASTRGRF